MTAAGELDVGTLGGGRHAAVEPVEVGGRDRAVVPCAHDHRGHAQAGQVLRGGEGSERQGCLQRRPAFGRADGAATAHGVAEYAEPVGVDAVAHRALLSEVVQRGEQLGAAGCVVVVGAVGVDADDDEPEGREPRPHPRAFGGPPGGVAGHGGDRTPRALRGVRRVVDLPAVEAVAGRDGQFRGRERAPLGGDAAHCGSRAALVRVGRGRGRLRRCGLDRHQRGDQAGHGRHHGRLQRERPAPPAGSRRAGGGVDGRRDVGDSQVHRLVPPCLCGVYGSRAERATATYDVRMTD